jgi:hypothetical protein
LPDTLSSLNRFALIPKPAGAQHPGPPGRSPAKKQVANLPQEVEMGTGWFCFFIRAVWQVQIVKPTHVFDFLWDGCESKLLERRITEISEWKVWTSFTFQVLQTLVLLNSAGVAVVAQVNWAAK